MATRRLLCLGLMVCTLLVRGSWGAAAEGQPGQSGADHWYHDYRKAMDAAAAQEAMLLIYFRPADSAVAEFFESRVLADPAVRRALAEYVCLQLDADAQTSVKGQRMRLLAHAAFRDMKKKPGVAILDLAHPNAGYYGRVVSALPFSQGRCYSAAQLAVVLDLPPGSAAERWREYWQRVRRADVSAKDATGAQAERLAPQAAEAQASKRPEQRPEQHADHRPEQRPEQRADQRPEQRAEQRPEQRAEQRAETQAAEVQEVPEVQWLDDYAAGCRAAKAAGRMLFIYFFDPAGAQRWRRFENETLGDKTVARKLQDYVCVRLPVGTEIETGGQRVVLLAHGAFRHMEGQPGVAIVDFAHPQARYYGHVVSTFPLTQRLGYSPSQMRVILELPPGELTQRTLIYAVRTHPEQPASTAGTPDPYLLEEARQHSLYQARIRVQGHHFWERRFHQINARLPAGLTACEVCAESWPGQGLVEAAIECVRSWRYSSGHWEAVSSYHPRYGYDIQQGANGIWYATGIFGRGRIARAELAQQEQRKPDIRSPDEAKPAGPQAAAATPGSLVGQQPPGH